MAQTKTQTQTQTKDLTVREASVLAVLGSGDHSGADLCMMLTNIVGLELRANSLYVSLGRMEKRKLIRSKRVGAFRVYKRMSPGKTALKKYLKVQDNIRELSNGAG